MRSGCGRSINMDPEEGCLRLIGVGDDGCPAFTEYGIECLKRIIIEERALLETRRDRDAQTLRCSPDAYPRPETWMPAR
jgi:hypothetical protein